MRKSEILYEANVEAFSKRHWRLLWPQIIIPAFGLFAPLFNLQQALFIILFWDTIMFALIVMMYTHTRKWAVSQVKRVIFDDDAFTIEVVTRDTLRTFKVQKDDLKVSLLWAEKRPPVLQLTVSDKQNQLFKIYSGGKRQLEEALDAIAYRILRKQQASANTC